jgi:hypothetical protein
VRVDIRIYDLVKQQLVKKLQPGAVGVSRLAVHSSGDHVLCGTRDRRMCWFDLDMGERPYKSLQCVTVLCLVFSRFLFLFLLLFALFLLLHRYHHHHHHSPLL